ncbi:WAS/WASL-interacting protein family member 1-like [Ananas comosus]|uniref:WAS/WASL-interacting protein family member 1-like n=1 Tax=Ananas comosus TaxID=4615 RepID=A0A6P5EY13_ANACO|nr:WAS/WASL-interacting protein family member 1-like [Ananas comosus]
MPSCSSLFSSLTAPRQRQTAASRRARKLVVSTGGVDLKVPCGGPAGSAIDDGQRTARWPLCVGSAPEPPPIPLPTLEKRRPRSASLRAADFPPRLLPPLRAYPTASPSSPAPPSLPSARPPPLSPSRLPRSASSPSRDLLSPLSSSMSPHPALPRQLSRQARLGFPEPPHLPVPATRIPPPSGHPGHGPLLRRARRLGQLHAPPPSRLRADASRAHRLRMPPPSPSRLPASTSRETAEWAREARAPPSPPRRRARPPPASRERRAPWVCSTSCSPSPSNKRRFPHPRQVLTSSASSNAFAQPLTPTRHILRSPQGGSKTAMLPRPTTSSGSSTAMPAAVASRIRFVE